MPLLLLLAGSLGGAQSFSNCASAGTSISFDFSSAVVSGEVNVKGTTYDRAGLGAYIAWLSANAPSQRFVPSAGISLECDLEPRASASQDLPWTLTLQSIGASLPAPLDTARLYIYVERISGRGESRVTSFTPVTANLPLARDTNPYPVGQGGGRYRVTFALEMRPQDGYGATYNATVYPSYRLQSP